MTTKMQELCKFFFLGDGVNPLIANNNANIQDTGSFHFNYMENEIDDEKINENETIKNSLSISVVKTKPNGKSKDNQIAKSKRYATKREASDTDIVDAGTGRAKKRIKIEKTKPVIQEKENPLGSMSRPCSNDDDVPKMPKGDLEQAKNEVYYDLPSDKKDMVLCVNYRETQMLQLKDKDPNASELMNKLRSDVADTKHKRLHEYVLFNERWLCDLGDTSDIVCRLPPVMDAPIMISRKYDEDFYREPVNDELCCMNDDNCIAVQLTHVGNGEVSSVILREYHTPDVLPAAYKRNKSEGRKPCLMCTLYTINCNYEKVISGEATYPPRFTISSFGHKTDIAGEYRSQDCICNTKDRYVGLMQPVLLFSTDKYAPTMFKCKNRQGQDIWARGFLLTIPKADPGKDQSVFQNRSLVRHN